MMANTFIDRLKNVTNQTTFNLFLELFHDKLVRELRMVLSNISPSDVRLMVKKSQYPYIPPEAFKFLHGYEQFLRKISVDYLLKMLIEARADIVTELNNLGAAGGAYIIGLRQYILRMIANPENAVPSGIKLSHRKPDEMVIVKCTDCGKSFPYPKADLDKMPECPFCNSAKEEPIQKPESTPPPFEGGNISADGTRTNIL